MQEENKHQQGELREKEDQANSTLSIEEVRGYLSTTEFDFNPTQDKISFPLIQRYVQMLKEGKEAPAIHVDDDIIVNGHHRYISGCLYERKPSTVPWTKAPSTPILNWTIVIVVEDDFGSNYDEQQFNKN
jgi:hypothetical protein